jgi:hypothetical protein
MTASEWANCDNPQPMIAVLDGKVEERLLRKFAVECCQRIWPLILEANAGAEGAVAAAKRLIDQQATSTDAKRIELYTAAAAACAAFAAAAVGANIAGDQDEAKSLATHAAFAASALSGTGYADEEAMIWSVAADAGFADDANQDNTERKAQADLLRAIIDNPCS